MVSIIRVVVIVVIVGCAGGRCQWRIQIIKPHKASGSVAGRAVSYSRRRTTSISNRLTQMANRKSQIQDEFSAETKATALSSVFLEKKIVTPPAAHQTPPTPHRFYLIVTHTPPPPQPTLCWQVSVTARGLLMCPVWWIITSIEDPLLCVNITFYPSLQIIPAILCFILTHLCSNATPTFKALHCQRLVPPSSIAFIIFLAPIKSILNLRTYGLTHLQTQAITQYFHAYLFSVCLSREREWILITSSEQIP